MYQQNSQNPVTYADLGISPLINASGSLTVLGGSIMNEIVIDAMRGGATCYVDLKQLKSSAGKFIAKLVGVEAAHVCSGASAGLSLMAAACMTGSDPSKVESIPHTDNIENRFIIHKSHRNKFDHAVHIVGGKFVEIDADVSALRQAVSKGAAALYYPITWLCPGDAIPLSTAAAVAREHGVPTIVDAASQLPPRENLVRFLNEGADAVAFSGGKIIGGPQSTGFILGRANLVQACASNDSPNVRCIGRGMKVGKEEILGLLTALRQYLVSDEIAFQEILTAKAVAIMDRLRDCPRINVTCDTPWGPGYQMPRLTIVWDETTSGLAAENVTNQLVGLKPPVHAQIHRASNSVACEIELFVHTLADTAEATTVGDRLRSIFDGETTAALAQPMVTL